VTCSQSVQCASLILASAAWKLMPKVAVRWHVRGFQAKPQDTMRLAMSFGELFI